MESLEKIEKIYREYSLRSYLNNIYTGGELTDLTRLWYSTIILFVLFVSSAWSGKGGIVLFTAVWTIIAVSDVFSKLRSDHKEIYESRISRIQRYKYYHQYPRYELFRAEITLSKLPSKDIKRAIEYLQIESATDSKYSIFSHPIMALLSGGFMGVFSSLIANQNGSYFGFGILIISLLILWFLIALIPEKLKHMHRKELLRFLLWLRVENNDL